MGSKENGANGSTNELENSKGSGNYSCGVEKRPFYAALSRKHNPLSPDAGIKQRLCHVFLCPPESSFARLLCLTFIIVMLWLTGASLLTEFQPGGHLFALLVLVVVGLIGGWVVELIHLPPLLGMIIVGILLRNVPYINVGADLDKIWSGKLRSMALVVILTRAGLGLDPVALKKLAWVVMRLAALPTLAEACLVAVCAHFFLEMPWIWGFMLGFVLAAVSPAVVVPCLLYMQDNYFGIDKGIPTMLIAASTAEDVVAIALFGIILGITFTKGSLAMQIAQAPIEVALGLGYGVILGIISWYIPNKKDPYCSLMRVIFALLGGMLAVFGAGKIHFKGAGALGCLIFAFVAAQGWRKQGHLKDGNIISHSFSVLWIIFQPVLFGLIGTAIDINDLNPDTVWYGILAMLLGLLIRLIVSFLTVMWGTEFNMKEKIFISIARLPKATVQAAIGPIAYDYAISLSEDDYSEEQIESSIKLGLQVLTVAVLAILITAPTGAAAIMLSGPRFLNHTPPKKDEKEEEANGEV